MIIKLPYALPEAHGTIVQQRPKATMAIVQQLAHPTPQAIPRQHFLGVQLRCQRYNSELPAKCSLFGHCRSKIPRRLISWHLTRNVYPDLHVGVVMLV